MKTLSSRLLAVAFLTAWGLSASHAQAASGIQPEVGVLRISEEDGQAQLSLQNIDNVPLLLLTQINDVPEDKGLVVVPVPPVTRVEPKARQIVRFALEKPKEPLKVQHYKRVTFEGIPPSSKQAGEVRVQMNVRYDLPVLISPRGLVQHEAPWELLQWSFSGNKLVVHNPSPFVVRMSREVDLMPGAKRFEALSRTFVLPGDTLSVELPKDVRSEAVTAVRVFPASLYGAAFGPFDAPMSSAAKP